MAKSAEQSVEDWMAGVLAEIEAQPTVAKSVHVLIAAVVAKAKGHHADLADLAHHGNKIAASVINGTAAGDEPLN